MLAPKVWTLKILINVATLLSIQFVSVFAPIAIYQGVCFLTSLYTVCYQT